MKANALSSDSRVDIIEIGHVMNSEGLPKEFIANAVATAFEFEGVYDLMRIWSEETDQSEKDATIADIQDMIDDCSQTEHVEGVYVRFDDLEQIAKYNRQFKDKLRAVVDKNGGLGILAQRTGIPQPSLSRFFNSASRPRRNFLMKIAQALGLSQIEIATEWLRR